MKYKIKKIWKNMNNAKEIIKELFFFIICLGYYHKINPDRLIMDYTMKQD